MSTVSKALNHLGFSNEDFVLQNNDGVDEIIEWYSSDPQPTQEAINQAKIDCQTEYDSKAYSRAREKAYPTIGDQLDMLWHAIDADTTLKSKYSDFYAAIKTVKDANPKS